VSGGIGVGPLLFLIYIRELIAIIERCGVTIKPFANDAKIYAEIIDIRDVEKLQRALEKWAELWQLKIAINKCCTLNIGKIPSCVLVSGTEYRIDDCVLKALQKANMILKCFISKDIKVLLRAYHTYVRPILEYYSVVWSPI